MSTHAVFTFKDQNNTFHVFKHWDGDPASAAQYLTKAKRKAWPLPRFEADDFSAAFVAANKPKGGGDIRLMPSGPNSYSHAYHYEVTHAGNTLHVKAFDARASALIFDGTLEELKRRAKSERLS